jgi:hypothetical protein
MTGFFYERSKAGHSLRSIHSETHKRPEPPRTYGPGFGLSGSEGIERRNSYTADRS